MFTTTNKLSSFLYILLGPVILLTLWFIIDKLNLIDSLYLPHIDEVVNKTVGFLLSDGIPAILFTLYRTFVSLFIAAALAIPLGLLLGVNKKIYNSTEIIIDFFRSVPATAFFPLFLLFFGINDAAKISISAFVCFWILLINTIYGVFQGSETRLKVAKIFKASGFKIFTNVIIFDALPQIMIGLRLSISIALVVVIVSEMYVGAKYGLGKTIYDSYLGFDTAQLFSTIFITGVLGFTINKLFVIFEKRLVHWVGK